MPVEQPGITPVDVARAGPARLPGIIGNDGHPEILTTATATTSVPPSSMAGSMSPGLGHAEGPPMKKHKQKRNKPTLSCEECVERKTKVCDTSLLLL